MHLSVCILCPPCMSSSIAIGLHFKCGRGNLFFTSFSGDWFHWASREFLDHECRGYAGPESIIYLSLWMLSLLTKLVVRLPGKSGVNLSGVCMSRIEDFMCVSLGHYRELAIE